MLVMAPVNHSLLLHEGKLVVFRVRRVGQIKDDDAMGTLVIMQVSLCFQLVFGMSDAYYLQLHLWFL